MKAEQRLTAKDVNLSPASSGLEKTHPCVATNNRLITGPPSLLGWGEGRGGGSLEVGAGLRQAHVRAGGEKKTGPVCRL